MAPGVASAPQGDHVTLSARDEGCPEPHQLCLLSTGQSLDAFQPGQRVFLIYENQASDDHNLYVTTVDRADPARENTDGSQAIAHSAIFVAPGQSEEFAVDVPTDATGLYFWCDLGNHEALGLRLVHEWSTQDDGDAEGGAPGPGFAALLLVVVGLAVAGGHWRRTG